MSTKHTPGPWVVEHGLSSDPAKYTPGIDADGENFTVILYGIKDEGEALGIRGRTDDEQEANARLIAAAPELLAALQDFVNDIVSNNPEDPLWVNARSAITKATGEQS